MGREEIVILQLGLMLNLASLHSLVLADPLPSGIGYWRSSDNRESEFCRSGAGHVDYAQLVPRRGRRRRTTRDQRRARLDSSHLSARVIVNRTVCDRCDDVPVIPLGVFLAALGDRPERNDATL